MVAQYDPCGRVVDLIRRPYTTTARYYDDPTMPPEAVEWYIARDDAELLDGSSAISSLDWCKGVDWYIPSILGERPDAARDYNARWSVPTALGRAVCGTAADFAGDGVRDPDVPPEPRRPDGLPVCCGWVVEGVGGVGIGGHAPPIYTPPVGDSCETGATLTLGVMVSGGGTVPPIWEQYWHYPSSPGTYHVQFASPDMFPWGNFQISTWTGGGCTGVETLQASGLFGGLPAFCVQFDAPADAHCICIRIQGANGTASYDLTLDNGPC